MSAEKVVSKVRYLRKKYGENKKLNDALSRVIWYSFDIVYFNTNYMTAYQNNINDYMTNYRIYKSCEKIINTPFMSPYMLTLTLDDDALLLSQRTLTDYIKTYTQKVCFDGYIFADYGAKNGRKHYHIIMTTFPDNVYKNAKGFLRLPIDWGYGFYNLTPITNYNSIRYAKKAFTYAKKANGERWKMRKSSKYIYPLKMQPYMNKNREGLLTDIPENFF